MFRFLWLTGFLFVCILVLTPSVYATEWSFSLTSDLVGSPTSGVAVIDFINGDGFNNSFAMITNLSSPASFYDGSFTGSGPEEYLVDDIEFFSSLYIELANIYDGFSFDLDVTFGDPGNFGFPDSLVVSLLDEFYSPAVTTSDPTGANSLALMSFQGNELFTATGFSVSISASSMNATSIPAPEPGTFILLMFGVSLLFIKRKKFIKVGLPVLLLLIYSAPSHAALQDVTNNVSIQKSPLVYNRMTRTFDGFISVTNISENTISSPLFLIISDVPETVSVNSSISLSTEGFPIVSLPIASEGLAPGQEINNFVIKFHNPDRVNFTARFVVMAGRDNLPPDPGEAGKASLEGIDSNNNGVRDDVEIFIELKFDDNPKKKEGLIQFAQTIQNGIVSTTGQASMQTANSQTRALECLMYLDPEDESWKEVETQAVNTPDRFNAWMEHQSRLSGKVFPMRRLGEWKTSCEFNPDN